MKCQVFLVISFVLFAAGTNAEVSEKKDLEEKSISKRGIVNFAGFPNPYHSAFGYQLPPAALSSFYPRYNLGFRAPPLFGLNAPYSLRHGGATVTSFNANFPRYPYYPNKFYNPLPLQGLVPHHFLPTTEQTPLTFAFPKPVFQPIPIGVASGPIPTGIIPSGHFPSEHIPSGHIPSGHTPSGHIPSGGHLPSGHIPSGTLPSGSIPTVSLAPGPLPSGSIPFGYPQSFFPIGIPTPTKQVPSFVATPTPGLNAIPDEWRPIFVNQPTPIPTPSIPRPAITLLPPYDHQRSSFDEELTQQDLLRIQGQQFLDSQLEQEKPQSIFHQQREQQDILETQLNAENSGNQNPYFGASSYDVPLQGNKGFNY